MERVGTAAVVLVVVVVGVLVDVEGVGVKVFTSSFSILSVARRDCSWW